MLTSAVTIQDCSLPFAAAASSYAIEKSGAHKCLGKSPWRLIGSGVTFYPPHAQVGPTDLAGTFPPHWSVSKQEH